MNRYRNILYYIGVIGFFSFLIYYVSIWGQGLEAGRKIVSHAAGLDQWNEIVTSFESNLSHPLTILLSQIIVILLVTRIFGWICKIIHQPVVIGEILAGIMMGPSLMGYYFPDFSAALFPPQSLGNLHIISQIGLILFMFMVGMELDFTSLKNKVNQAIIISHTGIIFSFTLGMILACLIYQIYAPPSVPFLSFALFLGISVSITAFPVLARIVQERGIHKTALGIFIITCAAVDDITAWSLLAIVIAVVKAGSFVSAVPTILLSVAYVVVMLKVVRPFLSRIGELHTTREHLTKPIVTVFFMVLMLSACTTEFIGIHAIFGGFMAGVIMPDNVKFRNIFIDKVEDVALVLFLPLFFVYTGLRTEIGLINDSALWRVCLLIIMAAVSGKFIGGSLAAKFTGRNWRDSLMVGSLMNSRGLVELVVLNIGFDLGVFTPQIFAMLVIMALVTTFMTAPALDLISRLFGAPAGRAVPEIYPMEKFHLLLSFGNPERGKSMIRLANCFIRLSPDNSSVTALHLSPVDDMFHTNMDDYEKESFAPLAEASEELNQPVNTLFKISNNIESDIADVANHGDFDLVVVGIGQSIFEGSLLGRMLGFTARIINPAKLFYHVTGKEKLWYNAAFDERLRSILSRVDFPVGVFIDKNPIYARNVLIPVARNEDAYLMKYARKLIYNADSMITISDPQGITRQDGELKDEMAAIINYSDNPFEIYQEPEIGEEFLKKFDLMLIGIENWARLLENRQKWLLHIPSTLILTS